MVAVDGFQRTSFNVAGCACFLSVPVDPLPGKPWVWRASFPDFHAEIDAELVRGGWHIGYIETGEMLGCDAALDLWDKFYDEVTGAKFGLAKKPVLEAVSRGGLYAYRWAARHPERVAALLCGYPGAGPQKLARRQRQGRRRARDLEDCLHPLWLPERSRGASLQGQPARYPASNREGKDSPAPLCELRR
ncbi:MAG: hypothetical protein QM758_04790 [Armatimonas sp.]